MPRDPKLSRKIGAAMRSLRRRRSFSVAEVATQMGYGPHGKISVHRWERGERGVSVEVLWSYLQAIDATFGDFGRELDTDQSSDRRLQEIAEELKQMATRELD